eukprot:tig00021037_g17432.t1
MSFFAVLGSFCGCPDGNKTRDAGDTFKVSVPLVVDRGADVPVSFKFPGDERNAWIGIFEKGAPLDRENPGEVEWKSIDQKSGTVVFSSRMLLQDREYVAALYENDDYKSLKAKSSPFVVGSWSVEVPQRCKNNSNIVVKFSAPFNNPGGWVGIYKVNSPDEQSLDFQFISGIAGELHFKANQLNPEFAYESRIFQDDGKTGYYLKGRSSVFVVTTA